MRKCVFLFFFITLSAVFCSAQDPNLPEADPAFMTDEYELIVLDGDTVLRSKITKEVYTMGFRKKGTVENASTFRTDWMNLYWNTKTFNPFTEAGDVTWPAVISFEGERFTMPIEGPITSRYGWRRGSPHKGIDIDLKTGDNVMVAMDGKVRFARYYSGFGNCIVVRHHNGLETIYAHLSKILVKPNDYVNSGQVIGKGGNTGRSRGSHLHFELRWFNKPINPEYLIDFETTKFYRAPQIQVDQLWADPRKHRSYKKSNIVVKRPGGTFYSPPVLTTQSQSVQKTAEQEITTMKKDEIDDGFRKQPETEQGDFAKSKTQFHEIVRGDTLAKIAKRYNTTVDEVCRLNGINKSAVLIIGKQLQVK